MTILTKIVENRLKLIEADKQSLSEIEIRQKSESLFESGHRPRMLLDTFEKGSPFLIAEIKKTSPSKGIIRKDFHVNEIARTYHLSLPVNAISILTEPDYFSGSYEYIAQVRAITDKPVLMKDFVIDAYQIYKGYLLGASAILLIASILDDVQIVKLSNLANQFNLDVLFEVHSATEYKRAINFDFKLIGINNRDLKIFKTDINNSIKILESEGKPEGKTIISESGINSKEDIELLMKNNVDGFLIGERFMKQQDIEKSILDLFGDIHD